MQVNLTEYNISHLLRPRGMNELRIRQLTLYKLHPETGLVDTHLHTIETTKYFHLYLFGKLLLDKVHLTSDIHFFRTSTNTQIW